MSSLDHLHPHPTRENLFQSDDVFSILSQREWLINDPTPEQLAFCEHAAALLGPHAVDSTGLEELLTLIFHYDAEQILQATDAHAVLSRYGARDVLRELALFLLDAAPFDSDRFKEAVTLLKTKLELRGRDLFYPLRLALAGRPGEGELDRVILLLDEAAALPFATPVKSTRTRIVQFCSALD
jgi:hypothetical protein